MFKYRKNFIYIITIIYSCLFIIELINYLFCSNNLFGLIYLLINLFIIFLLVPLAYNYNRYYSAARISKLIMVTVLGIFSSYILELIVSNSMSYVDAYKLYSGKVFIIKDILKGIIYFLLIGFTVLEFRLDKKLINKTANKKEKKS